MRWTDVSKTLAGPPAGAPGVDASSIHFATVVAGTADPKTIESMLSVMRAWVGRRNRENVNKLSKRGRGAWYMEDFYRAYRERKLDVWKLKGEPVTWAAQLDAYCERQSVFALIGVEWVDFRVFPRTVFTIFHVWAASILARRYRISGDRDC